MGPKRPRNAGHSPTRRIFLGLIVLIVTLLLLSIVVFPFYWILIGSLKTETELFEIPPTFFPKMVTLMNYQKVYAGDFFKCLVNSLIIAFLSTAIALILAAPAAYVFSRSRYLWLRMVFFVIMTVRMLPPVSLTVPMYLMFRALGLHNTRLALAISHLTWQIPFVVWMLESHFRGIPSELEEAAQIDGCSRILALAHIILPLAAPGLSVAAIFAFITSWNEFPLALVLTSTTAAKTATVNIAETITSYQIFWGQMMASGIIFAFPVMFFSLFVQRYLIETLITGSVKE